MPAQCCPVTTTCVGSATALLPVVSPELRQHLSHRAETIFSQGTWDLYLLEEADTRTHRPASEGNVVRFIQSKPPSSTILMPLMLWLIESSG